MSSINTNPNQSPLIPYRLDEKVLTSDLAKRISDLVERTDLSRSPSTVSPPSTDKERDIALTVLENFSAEAIKKVSTEVLKNFSATAFEYIPHNTRMAIPKKDRDVLINEAKKKVPVNESDSGLNQESPEWHNYLELAKALTPGAQIDINKEYTPPSFQ